MVAVSLFKAVARLLMRCKVTSVEEPALVCAEVTLIVLFLLIDRLVQLAEPEGPVSVHWPLLGVGQDQT